MAPKDTVAGAELGGERADRERERHDHAGHQRAGHERMRRRVVVERQEDVRRERAAGEAEGAEHARRAAAVLGHGLDASVFRPVQSSTEPAPASVHSAASCQGVVLNPSGATQAAEKSGADDDRRNAADALNGGAQRASEHEAGGAEAGQHDAALERAEPHAVARVERDHVADAGDGRVAQERRAAEEAEPAREQAAHARALAPRRGRCPRCAQ